MKKIIFFSMTFILVLSMLSSDMVVKSKDINENTDLRNFDIDLNGYNNVMFVAHPDDDMIWGGSHLIDDDYLVVCITCGSKQERVEEFKNVMEATGDKYIMLNYPDKTNGERDNWNEVYADITNDIENILAFKKWNIIVTHNKDGEYGHIHHKMTHNIVTDIYEKKYLNNNSLYFFGKYYKESDIDSVKDTLKEISQVNYDKKISIIYDYYVSQKSAADGLSHMFKYENWDKYEKGE